MAAGVVVAGFEDAGVVGALVVPVVTVMSSKLAVAFAVCRPIRPAEASALPAEPMLTPLMLPLIVEPRPWRLSVYQVPVVTVLVEVASTVTAPLLTACSWAWPETRARR
ncbi:hypothetical protein [Kineosporia succinea]